MNSILDLIQEGLGALGQKPADDAKSHEKKRYSERTSEKLASAFAAALRSRGLEGTQPGASEDGHVPGTERRMSGGIGAKKVDVTWATEASGLLLAMSIKTINFKDERSGNFQKNLTNRRGDMLFEAVTLHRRFPYAVLAGFFFLDQDAKRDDTERRQSTFLNAHQRLQMFTGRDDPWGRDEQYEKLYVGLIDSTLSPPGIEIFLAGAPSVPVPLTQALDDLIQLVGERNPDFYSVQEGTLKPT